jgi:hypothetical protein
MADMADQTAPFQRLDFLYTPSRDVATDLVGTVALAVTAVEEQDSRHEILPVGCRNSFMQLVGGTRGADHRADPAGVHGADPR